jgi:hypothetical protein
MNIKVWLKLALTLTMLTAFTGLATAQQKSERTIPHPPQPTCRMDAAGMCGGTCPKGQVCQKKGPGVCGCTEEPTCGLHGTNICSGTCPKGQVCQGNTTTLACGCMPPKSTCGPSASNMCGGTCVGPDQGKVCIKNSKTGVCGCGVAP